jgi:hypothetical protein
MLTPGRTPVNGPSGLPQAAGARRSAFPLGAEEGFRPGELYALGDVVGLRFFRDLLALNVDRIWRLALLEQSRRSRRQGDFWAYRKIAAQGPPWWWFFPVVEGSRQGIAR